MKKLTQKVSVVTLCLIMVVLSMIPAFAASYVENHNYVDCASYYIDGHYYRFLIKIPKGTPLSAVTVKDAYTNGEKLLSNISGSGAESIEYQYTDDTSDCYLYSFNLSAYGTPKYSWYYYGIKLYYDYNGNHYMATNTSIGSTVEGEGYRLIR